MRLYSAIILLISQLGVAQQLKGKIVDEQTGEPLMNITIYLDGTSIGVVSSIDGRFILDKPEEINAHLILSSLTHK